MTIQPITPDKYLEQIVPEHKKHREVRAVAKSTNVGICGFARFNPTSGLERAKERANDPQFTVRHRTQWVHADCGFKHSARKTCSPQDNVALIVWIRASASLAAKNGYRHWYQATKESILGREGEYWALGYMPSLTTSRIQLPPTDPALQMSEDHYLLDITIEERLVLL